MKSSNTTSHVETLEARQLLSAAATSQIFPPHAVVAGQSMEQWAADWWKLVFETPMHTGDQITHPNFDETGAQGAQGDVGNAFFLFGTFSGGELTRTVNVPAGKPILVPVLPMEFSNYDTAGPNGELPGPYTLEQLEAFNAASAKSVITRGELHGSIDGRPFRGLTAHREHAPVEYVLPAEDNVLQFFGLPFSGPVSPACVDGFYMMLRPLSPGQHDVVFGGSIPTNEYPVLSDFSIEMTYILNVVPQAPERMWASPSMSSSPFTSAPEIQSAIDLLEAELAATL